LISPLFILRFPSASENKIKRQNKEKKETNGGRKTEEQGSPSSRQINRRWLAGFCTA
jgi:hypothetical protein